MMYSQINYLGCILPFDIMETQQLSLLIENFVRGNLNVSRKRLFLSVEEGGLGLFKLADFLDALRCSWVKRAQSLDDHWKRTIYAGCYGNVLNIRSANFPQIEGPIIHCIAKSYENFVIKHTQWNENLRHALVFNNQSLTTGLGNENLADGDFFAEYMNNYTDRVYRICDSPNVLKICILPSRERFFLTSF